MASIFDDYNLNSDKAIEKFEAMIGHGMSKLQITTAFRVTSKEMDKWCKEHYNGCDFSYVYEAVKTWRLIVF